MSSIRFGILALGLLASLSESALAQAYKCSTNGAVVFQQTPCQGGVKLDVAPPPEPNSREARVATAIAKKRVFIGMTDTEIVRSWGKPDKINRSISDRNVNEQWIYERDNSSRSQYLYVENGVLRSIQSPE
jgi:hypothetical protein